MRVLIVEKCHPDSQHQNTKLTAVTRCFQVCREVRDLRNGEKYETIKARQR